MKLTSPALSVFLAALLVTLGGFDAAAQDEDFSIDNIAGEVYRFRHRFHYSVFAVTPDGIIATDPINAGAAEWLKAELKKRFNLPVKYLDLQPRAPRPHLGRGGVRGHRHRGGA